jgi:hypothetical protein
MDILSKNSKKEYPQSITGLLRLEEKGLCKASVSSQTQFLNLSKKRGDRYDKDVYKTAIEGRMGIS